MDENVRTKKKKIACIILSVVFLFVFFYVPATASDDLFLNGTVLEVNQNSNQAVVNVKTLGCKGKMTFKAENEDIGTLKEFLGKEISFFIDSANCKDKQKTYKIKKLHIKVSKGTRQ